MQRTLRVELDARGSDSTTIRRDLGGTLPRGGPPTIDTGTLPATADIP